MGIETALLLPALIGAGGAVGSAALSRRSTGSPDPNAGGGPAGTYTPQAVFPGVQSTFGSYLSGQAGRGNTPYPGAVNAPRDPSIAGAGDTLNQWMGYANNTLTPRDEGLTNYLTNFGRRTENLQTPNMNEPVTALPAWQAMIAAQQRNIGQNAAQLREQFSGQGARYGSGIQNTMQDFFAQTGLQQNALLADQTRQALESSKGRDIQISQLGFGKEGLNLQAANQLASYLQAQKQLGPPGFNQQLALGSYNQQLGQADIGRMMQEWMRQQPEYSQLLPYLQGAAVAYPPFSGTPQYQQNPWANVVNTGSGIGMEVLMQWLRNRAGQSGGDLGGVPGTYPPELPPPVFPGGIQ